MQAKLLTEIIAEHAAQVRELTQRIGDLCRQVNERDRYIAQVAVLLESVTVTGKTVRLQWPDLIGSDDVLPGETK